MGTPTISILVPTFRREVLFERNLRKCASALRGLPPDKFELLVGDNGNSQVVKRLTKNFEEETGVSTKYFCQPTANMQENHNRLAESAVGRFLQFVHDDDFLLPRAGAVLLASAAHSEFSTHQIPTLHSVFLVNVKGSLRKKQSAGKPGTLSPLAAVRNLVGNSSFIRFPAMFIPSDLFRQLGGFNPAMGNLFDLDFWLKAATRGGLRISDRFTAAYTIHSEAETNTMFTEQVIGQILEITSDAASKVNIPTQELHTLQGQFLWKFTLAGCLRALRSRNVKILLQRCQLMKSTLLLNYPCPGRWNCLRIFFTYLCGFKGSTHTL